MGTIKPLASPFQMPGTLFVVATPIGNLEDVTTRALRILRQVGLIAAEDTRRTNHLLSRYAIGTPTTSFHEHNESRKVNAVVERLQRGEDIALVSDAGTPTISDPGQRLIRAAIDAGIRVEPVPGPSAAVTALAASGIGCQTFTFLGFPPIRLNERKKWLAELAVCRQTRCLLRGTAPDQGNSRASRADHRGPLRISSQGADEGARRICQRPYFIGTQTADNTNRRVHSRR